MTKKSFLAITMLLFALHAFGADQDDAQFIRGTLVHLQHKKTTVYTTVDQKGVPQLVSKTKTYAFVVRIGDTLYTGEAEKDTSLSGRLASGISGVGNFNAKDWSGLETNDVLVRFQKKGLAFIAMTVKQPSGKHNTMYLKSIVGPDGKEQCGKKMGCTTHNFDSLPQASAAPAE